MLILLERPSTTHKFGLLARKNGKYQRPIVGDVIDFRVEDFMPQSLLHSLMTSNFIGRLPDIPAIGQTNQYFVATFNIVSAVSEEEVQKLLPTNQYVLLPHEPSSAFWQYTEAPWWEFAVVLDKYDGFIKAPYRPRSGEPSVEEADERIDEFPENHGKVHVLAPSTLIKWEKKGTRENYLEKLKRI